MSNWVKIKHLINKFKKVSGINKVLLGMSGVALIFVMMFVFWWNNEIVINKIDGENEDEINNTGPKSSIMGISCDRALIRPIAVMLAGDVETRPLSGISGADMVIEMPVAPNGITRLMAVYQCQLPDEIGSIRSSRGDFIPLAQGLKAIYAHWGGEQEALAKLNKGVIDNIDGLKYENIYYYRKKGMLKPHNGFTSAELLDKAIKELKYDTSDSFAGYPHTDKIEGRNLSNLADLVIIDYPKPFNSTWVYEPKANSYKRIRDEKPEIDKSNGEQVSVSVVVVMKTKVAFWRDQYMRVAVEGGGDAEVYQDGIVINGKWKKDPANSEDKLSFYDINGKEISFLPGKIWIEIVNN